MKNVLRFIARLILGLLGLFILLFIILYFIHSGHYQVAKTVEQDPSIPHIALNGAIFHCETYGHPENPVVIVLHGGPGNDFRALLDLRSLADNYYVVFYDQRGSGLSPRVSAEELTLNNMFTDLDAFVDHFGKGTKVHLIGHSWGAILASGYIARHPGKVHKVVLAEPGFLNEEMYHEFMEVTNGFALELTWPVFRHVVQFWFESLHVNGPDRQARMDYFMSRLIWDTYIPDHPLAGYYCDGNMQNRPFDEWRGSTLSQKTLPAQTFDDEGLFLVDMVSGLENYQDTALFLASACNKIIGVEFQEKQLKYYPHARLAIIENAGHNMIAENPLDCLAVIRDYLGE